MHRDGLVRERPRRPRESIQPERTIVVSVVHGLDPSSIRDFWSRRYSQNTDYKLDAPKRRMGREGHTAATNTVQSSAPVFLISMIRT